MVEIEIDDMFGYGPIVYSEVLPTFQIVQRIIGTAIRLQPIEEYRTFLGVATVVIQRRPLCLIMTVIPNDADDAETTTLYIAVNDSNDPNSEALRVGQLVKAALDKVLMPLLIW